MRSGYEFDTYDFGCQGEESMSRRVAKSHISSGFTNEFIYKQLILIFPLS